MDLNTKILLKINSFVGRSKLLDSFGRAGAEWIVVAMIGWYAASVFIGGMSEKSRIFWPLAFLAAGWCVGWTINLLLAVATRESRPYILFPQIKILFKPMMSWKSFPSDHSMSAFLIFFMACIFQLPGAWALAPMALWVVWGRLYAGVHYPLDILGGLGVAMFISAIARYLASLI
ncbi:MAG: phosphatase PAP2 family protein [Candidatus Magasanikbacteria bacterium]|nr:phosphatase PAP2 family protein [Candidatus Magasanikbacteria bacterium]